MALDNLPGQTHLASSAQQTPHHTSLHQRNNTHITTHFICATTPATLVLVDSARDRNTEFALVLRDARAHKMSSIASFAGAGQVAAAAERGTFVGSGRALGGKAASSDGTYCS
jgi:hypothetical protein